MDPVALAATIGGTAVGLAGVAATVRSSRLQQQSAMEIASLQHEHERELARGGRLFERRAAVYEEMLRLLYAWMRYVDAIWSFASSRSSASGTANSDRSGSRAVRHAAGS
jgi:hypothetical protein